MQIPRLQLESVSYRYASGVQAVAPLSLELDTGIVGLLGPNGAGKSTLIRMLATLTKPSEGRILWQGVDSAREPDALRAVLGYLPQEFGAYPSLSAREFLAYLAAVKGLPHQRVALRVQECLDLVGLGPVADQRIGQFSGGMRQRVGIAQALLSDPQLLIVDEPTVGLDPDERLRFRNMLTDLAGHRLVILSTHIVSDIEASASMLVVLDRGQLRFFGRPETLLTQAQGQVWDWVIRAEQLAEVRAQYQVSASLRCTEGVRVRVIADRAPSADAVAAVPGLEDAYVCLLRQVDNANA